jgi:tryptophan synthase alpha chain
MAADIGDLSERVRRQTQLPLALGFGISRPEHVAEACRHADAAVVGSAIVKVIAEAGSAAPNRVREYVRWLKGS